MSIQQLSKLLILTGIIIAAIGAITLFGARFRWLRIGRLPGDIVIQRDSFSFFFPITSMLLISAVLTLVLWLAGALKR